MPLERHGPQIVGKHCCYFSELACSPYLRLCLLAVAENDRKENALLIAASLIAAVRTAREERILPTIPSLVSKVGDSVRLARMVLKEIERDKDGKADERYVRSLDR